MAAPGGRRTKHVVFYLSWAEATAFETVRFADSRQAGTDLSRADWLLQVVQDRLRAYVANPECSPSVRQRCVAALQTLDYDRNRPVPRRPGRPPQVY
jgi:hypothetical protein